MSKNKMVSLLCPLAFLAFGIWVRVEAAGFKTRDARFPNLIAYVTIVIAIIDLIVELRKTEHKNRFKDVEFLRLIACVAAMALYVFLLKKIGFYFDTVLLCGFTMWILGYKNWKVLIPCAIIIAAVVFFAFYVLMKVPLPTLFLHR